jgi:Flp pilus assembly protein TadG
VHYEVSRNRSSIASDTGSGIVGFVLVAPLVVAIFIAIGQVAMLVADKSVLNSAAAIGARTASAADATNTDGRNAVLKV